MMGCHEIFIETITTSIFHLKKKTLQMTWLEIEFILIFITGPSRSKLGRRAQQQLLLLVLLPGWISSWSCVSYISHI
jgi:hypothetical protein